MSSWLRKEKKLLKQSEAHKTSSVRNKPASECSTLTDTARVMVYPFKIGVLNFQSNLDFGFMSTFNNTYHKAVVQKTLRRLRSVRSKPEVTVMRKKN